MLKTTPERIIDLILQALDDLGLDPTPSQACQIARHACIYDRDVEPITADVVERIVLHTTLGRPSPAPIVPITHPLCDPRDWGWGGAAEPSTTRKGDLGSHTDTHTARRPPNQSLPQHTYSRGAAPPGASRGATQGNGARKTGQAEGPLGLPPESLKAPGRWNSCPPLLPISREI
jgi:hypothetical protein